jgi:hypothetical protein
VRYSPNWRISLLLSTRKVSLGSSGPNQVGGVEDGAQFVAAEAVDVGVVGVEFGSEQGSVFEIEDEGWAVWRLRGMATLDRSVWAGSKH